MNRSDWPRGPTASLALMLFCTFACGSVTPEGDAGSTAGRGGAGAGSSGSGGQPGAAGSQANAGSGGSGNGGVSGGGHAGIDAGVAGAGGLADGGAKDAAVGACAQVATVDQSCAVDTDCLAVMHTTSCCGSAVWIGIRSSEQQHFAALEGACDRTYPACGCAAGPPQTDDGSIVPFGGMAAASCQGGTCKTFSKACGHPCDSGRSCVTCMSPDAGATSVCSLQCLKDTTCTEANRTKCQFVFSTGICVDPMMACSAL
jgi:hypothetical protein